MIPLRVAEVLTKHQRKQLIEGLVDAWCNAKWAALTAKNSQCFLTMDDRVVTSCCLQSKVRALGQDKTNAHNMAEKQQKLEKNQEKIQQDLEEGKISYLETLPYDEVTRLTHPKGGWGFGFPKAEFVKVAMRNMKGSRKTVMENILDEVSDMVPDQLVGAIGLDVRFLKILKNVLRLKKGEPIPNQMMRNYTDDFFEANEHILPKEIRPLFRPDIAKMAIRRAREKEEFMKEVHFDEELFQKHSYWIPRKVAELLTPEETEKVVEILRGFKKERDTEQGGSTSVPCMPESIDLPPPIPCVAPSIVDSAQPEDTVPKKMRFLTGMKVRVSNMCKNKEKVGLEGVLSEVGSKTGVLKLFDQITTTVVRCLALEPFVPEVGEPCKLLGHNETEAVGRILDFVEEDMDFVMVQFDGEASCRKIKLDNLCAVFKHDFFLEKAVR